MSYYYVVEVTEPHKIEDLDQLAFDTYQSTGIEEFSINEARVDEILGIRSYSGGDLPLSVLDEVNDVVTGAETGRKYYFSTKDSAESFEKYCQKYTELIVLNECVQEDWNAEWKKHYKPIVVDDNLAVVPNWEEDYKGNSEHNLYIVPGMGFGTGSHETTFLCLKLYTSLPVLKEKAPIDVLDFGSGSGILGLATLLFNRANNVDLYDIDAEAMVNAAQNISENKMDECNIKKILPSDREVIEKKYELVFANILENVLLLERDYLCRTVKKNGHLILSGLLNEQVDGIIDTYTSNGVVLIEHLSKGDWSALLFQK